MSHSTGGANSDILRVLVSGIHSLSGVSRRLEGSKILLNRAFCIIFVKFGTEMSPRLQVSCLSSLGFVNSDKSASIDTVPEIQIDLALILRSTQIL